MSHHSPCKCLFLVSEGSPVGALRCLQPVLSLGDLTFANVMMDGMYSAEVWGKFSSLPM